jgi:peptidoglycan/LPS O-acetylase OafA/YrhL
MAKSEGTTEGVVLWALFSNSIDAFFMISAFVLFLPAVRRGGSLGNPVRFWIGRIARLAPTYWLVLGIAVLVTTLWPPHVYFPPASLREFAAHITFMQMPAQLIDTGANLGFGINPPVWLISIVVTFYFLLPLISRAYFRHPLIGLAIAAAITLGWKELIAHAVWLFHPISNAPDSFIRYVGIDQFPGWAFSFALGMTGAWAYVYARRRWDSETLARFGLRALPIALGGFLVFCYLRGRYSLDISGNIGPTFRLDPIPSMGDSLFRAATMAAIVIGPAWVSKPFDNRLMRWFADNSYGVYLVHWVLVSFYLWYLSFPQTGTLANFALWIVAVVPASILFAYLSRRFVELPITRWVGSWPLMQRR